MSFCVDRSPVLGERTGAQPFVAALVPPMSKGALLDLWSFERLTVGVRLVERILRQVQDVLRHRRQGLRMICTPVNMLFESLRRCSSLKR